MLLESYTVTDQEVCAAIESETTDDRKLACHRGCAASCRTHKSIPVTSIELVEISWYATEKVDGLSREKLIAQLQTHKSGGVCPSLVDEACSIYEFQPYTYRHFNVFNQICEEGEDAFYIRKEDVLTPYQSTIDEANFTTLLFYGLEQNEENNQKIREGEINKVIHVLQELNWESLAAKISAFNQANT